MRFGKKPWLNSLRAKVLLAFVAGSVLSIVLIASVALAVVTSQGDIFSATDVANLTEDLAGMLQFDREGKPLAFDDGEGGLFSWLYESLKQETAYRVLDASGKAVLHSAAGEAFWPTTGPVRRLEPGRFDFAQNGVEMRGATALVHHDGQVWYLQNAVSKRFMHLSYRAFALPFTGAGILLFSLVLLVVFGTTAYGTLKYTLAPLRQISEAAAAISPRSLHARLRAHKVPREIAPLVDSFNHVLDRLERGYRIQQDFLSTAAHELKTPLALLRAQIEMSVEGEDRGFLLNDVEHMSRQVQQLLVLAEASERHNYRFAVVDVGHLVTEVTHFLRRMAEAAEVNVVTPEGASGPQWLADRAAFFTLLKNMVENAVQHAPKGTEVQVEVGPTELSVRDRGPGVAPEHLPHLFSRFWRGSHRRDQGAGLGLAICEEIALAHGWTLSAYREEPGLRLCLSLTARGEALPA